jgi:hypothetical protein
MRNFQIRDNQFRPLRIALNALTAFPDQNNRTVVISHRQSAIWNILLQ